MERHPYTIAIVPAADHAAAEMGEEKEEVEMLAKEEIAISSLIIRRACPKRQIWRRNLQEVASL